ncbi:hypothetical protein V8E54_000337 [Elaphomyces granulatus]
MTLQATQYINVVDVCWLSPRLASSKRLPFKRQRRVANTEYCTKVAVEEGSIKEETKKALLLGCQTQINLLGNLISRSAISSLRQDAKVTKITAILRTHIQSLTNYRVTPLSILQYDSLVADIVDKDNLHGQSHRSRYPFGVIETLSCPKYRPDALSQLLEWHLSVFVALGQQVSACDQILIPSQRVVTGHVGLLVHASSAAQFEEGYRGIAERAEIAVWDNPEANILSRFRITGDTRDIIPVDPMDDRITVDLLRRKLQGDFNENDAKRLHALDYMPPCYYPSCSIH